VDSELWILGVKNQGMVNQACQRLTNLSSPIAKTAAWLIYQLIDLAERLHCITSRADRWTNHTCNAQSEHRHTATALRLR